MILGIILVTLGILVVVGILVGTYRIISRLPHDDHGGDGDPGDS